MMRRPERRALLGSLALAVGAMVPWFASCAETEEAGRDDADARVSVPEPDAADAGGDATPIEVDAGCDASDDNCVAHVISCADAPWCPVPTTVSTFYALTAVWGSGKNDVWAVGSGGTIAHWDGSAWKQTPTGVKNTLRAVWGTGPTDVWVVSMTDTILHTSGFSGGSAVWERVPGATDEYEATSALSIWGTPGGEVRIGARTRFVWDPDTSELTGFDQYTLKKDGDGGIAWAPAPGEGNVLGFWGSATDLWLIADNSERNGWEKGVTRHGIVAKGDGLEWKSVDSQSTVRLEGIWGSSHDDIWAVGDKGTIRRMRKGAARWEIVSSPTTEALHAVWGSAANDVWAVGDNGTILHFDGTSWKPSQAAFGLGLKPDLYGVWGSSADDVWIVGDSVALHYTGGAK